MMLPKWIDAYLAYLPPRGPCGICGGPDARHRIVDAIRSSHKAGDSVADLARWYEVPEPFVARLCLGRLAQRGKG